MTKVQICYYVLLALAVVAQCSSDTVPAMKVTTTSSHGARLVVITPTDDFCTSIVVPGSGPCYPASCNTYCQSQRAKDEGRDLLLRPPGPCRRGTVFIRYGVDDEGDDADDEDDHVVSWCRFGGDNPQ
ncbi:hypothetical protein ABZP36_009607 [Zizania latifolia]